MAVARNPMILFTCMFHAMVVGRKAGIVLFNDTLNTFHLRIHGGEHMIIAHIDDEKGNPLPPLHGVLTE